MYSMTTSVALCTYNGSKFLKEQLNSILSQTVAVDEIIVCDDGSTDDTLSLLDSYREHFPFIIINRNTKTIGGKKNFEKALSLCTGDIIFLSDQDDVWHEKKVEIIVDYFSRVDICEGLFHNAGMEQGSTLWDVLNFQLIREKLIPAQLFKAQLFYRNFVTGACLAIRKTALTHILPFQLMEHMWHDEWIAIVLSKRSSLHWLNQPLIYYRKHDEQQTDLPAEVDNKDLDKVTKAIYLGNYSAFPLYTYFHFKRRLQHVQNISESMEISKQLVNEIEGVKRKSLVEYFKGLGFYDRKRELVKWFIKKEDISIKDVITI
jgi:glycosyltransferase involved in cell wall biosynthesis